MGKMMSLLEKYKIVEKETPETDDFVQMSSEDTSSEIESDSSDEVLQPDTALQADTSNEKGEDTMPSDYNENASFSVQEETSVQPQPTTEIYHEKQSIDTIYHYAGLGGKAVTDTAFFLENLIKALPDELPEYVKKTTIDNIINASNIDLNKLISDGKDRFQQLNSFQDTFSNTNFNEIAALKQEIDRLTATITNYHQEIKQKEMLVQEEAELIEEEKARLNHILTFFKAE